MIELQHRFVHYRHDERPPSPKDTLRVIAEELNAGWQIVSATPIANALGELQMVVYVLKRSPGAPQFGDPH